MSDIYLSIGGNLEDRLKNIGLSQQAISDKIGHILDFSPIYETEPWGFKHERHFYNQVLRVQSDLAPEQVLKRCLYIEKSLGRERNASKNKNYAGRTMDIDIIFYDDFIIDKPALQIPHPDFKNRLFVLIPLNDIAPDFIDPGSGKSIETLKENCSDTTSYKKTKLQGKQLHHETK
ncbi:MAG: 2-amino-4-hydroxy-6-hydroxymethyldihydropteridine diphosphokinase [Candidatus Delongbacteria bacterium]|jgi:2-amino-4-hydroxy-6-hydroxymethyldihydropteridine diphosphokinase|nr:2-amino-4-hydroxy-6-hydroxymethyldihydropteridine diphosphokinase [Candidatus Delongbacteria bacterium]